MKQYIIAFHNDNGVDVKVIDAETLEKRLNENYYGSGYKFASELPNDFLLCDTDGDTKIDYKNMIIIEIKQIVVPKAVEKIIKYEL